MYNPFTISCISPDEYMNRMWPGVELSPPFLLPAWPFPSVGCLGAVTRRLTPAPNREAGTGK